jgi:hypothetical protein
MKKAIYSLFIIVGLLAMAGCAQNETAKMTDRRPMLMVEGKIYLDTGKQIPVDYDDAAILGRIDSSVGSSEIPTKNGESNFGSEGAKYAFYEDGIVVLLQNKWICSIAWLDKLECGMVSACEYTESYKRQKGIYRLAIIG